MFDEKSTDTYFFIGGIQEEIKKEEYNNNGYDEYIDNDYEYYDDLAYYYDSIIDDYNDY
tara:strand:+ start:103 stop:279 length:177 start_codon:yes stop_codon:yes gene_type:complete